MVRENYSLTKKKNLLKNILKKFDGVVVALSGGVDSSLVMASAREVLKQKAVGAIAISSSLSADNLRLSRELAKLIGAELVEVQTPEVSDPEYQKNTPLRCYFCKHIVYSEFRKIAAARNAALVDGFNVDDSGETRPGMKAAKEEGVRHPLFEAGITKNEVRMLAKGYGLPNWNKSADACLSSRILTGIPVNSSLVKTIGELESKIRRRLNLSAENTIRLRYLGSGKTRVELDKPLLPLSLLQETEIKKIIENYGYTNIAFAAYQRGSASATNIYQ